MDLRISELKATSDHVKPHLELAAVVLDRFRLVTTSHAAIFNYRFRSKYEDKRKRKLGLGTSTTPLAVLFNLSHLQSFVSIV